MPGADSTNTHIEQAAGAAEPESRQALVDEYLVEAAATAIRQATRKDNLVDTGTDEDAIYRALGNLSEADRKALLERYEKKYDVSLDAELRSELSGADLDKALNLVQRKDNKTDDASFIHELFTEMHQTIRGRSRGVIGSVLEKKLGSISKDDLDALDKEYKDRYGTGLRDTIKADTKLNASVKSTLDRYFATSDRPDEQAPGHTLAQLIEANSSWLGDNEKAIEQAITSVSDSDSERQSYRRGRELSLAQTPEKDLSDLDRQSLAFYRETRKALAGAGNATELAQWEAMLIHQGSPLIRELAAHRGTFKDSSTDEVLASLERMAPEDWQRLKNDSSYRRDVEKLLGTYLSTSEMSRAQSILDGKQAQGTFEQAKASGKRPVLDVIADQIGFVSNDNKGVIQALGDMRPEDQQKYRDDINFRRQVDTAVLGVLKSGPSLDAARNTLDRIAAGKNPSPTLVERLAIHALDFNTDEGQVIRDLQTALRDDPTLRQRLTQPQTAADQAFSKRFFSVLHGALDDDEYQRYAEPLLKTGSLSLEVQNELDDRFLHRDKKAILDNLMSTSQGERARLLGNDASATALQDRIFANFDADFKKLALNTIEQGAMRPEDAVRSFVLGAGVSQQEVLAIFNQLKPEQRQPVTNEYARKYGGTLSVDLLAKISTADKDRAELLIKTTEQSAADTFNFALDKHSLSRSGIGSVLMDSMWDGTGLQADEKINRFAAEMARSAELGKALDTIAAGANANDVFESLNTYRESKAQLGETAANVGITAAAIGGAAFTGGASLSLLAKVAIGGAAGAAIKVGTKSAIIGSDYSWSASQLALDGGTGFIYGATAFGGTQAAGRLLGVGAKDITLAARYGVPSLASAIAGGASGTVDGFAAWDASRTLDQNLFSVGERAVSNAAIGAGSALVFTAATRAIGSGYEFLRRPAAAVDQVTDAPVPPVQDRIPGLKLDGDDFSIKASVEGDTRAWFRAELPKDGVVKVTDIFKGDLPRHGGSKLLAQALAAHEAVPTQSLVFKHITNNETVAAFLSGADPAKSLLGRTGARALQTLGLTPTAYRWEFVDGRHLNLVIDLR